MPWPWKLSTAATLCSSGLWNPLCPTRSFSLAIGAAPPVEPWPIGRITFVGDAIHAVSALFCCFCLCCRSGEVGGLTRCTKPRSALQVPV